MVPSLVRLSLISVTMCRHTDNWRSHIDWHLQAGLAVVFAEDPADVASHNPVSSEWISPQSVHCILIQLQLRGAISALTTTHGALLKHAIRLPC